MNKIKLIELEMDGTLLKNNDEVAKETVEGINFAREKGVKVIIATGSPFQGCMPYAKKLQLEDYVIVSNGAEIWSMEDKLIKRSLMEQSLLENLWEIGEDLQTHMWAISTEQVFHSHEPPINFSDHQWLKMGYAQIGRAH